MRSIILKRVTATILTAGLGTWAATAGNLDQLNYVNVPGATVDSLFTAPNNGYFPNIPFDAVPYTPLINPNISVPPDTFIRTTGDGTQDSASWIRGFIEPPQTGTYVFWVSGSSDAQFYLSSNASSGSKVLEAWTGGATGADEWFKNLSQKSRPIPLEKGQQYYFELIQKSSSPGGSASIGWWLPDYTLERPIPIRYAQRFVFQATCIYLCTGDWVAEQVVDPPRFVRGPGNNGSSGDIVAYLTENQPYDLTPWLDANYPIAFQWQEMAGFQYGVSQGTPTDIAGDITATKYFKNVTIANNDGKAYRLKATRNGTDTFSKIVQLQVQVDTTAPSIVSASASGNTNGFNVVYSENVDPTTATNKDNYTINTGVVIDHVEMRYGDVPNNVVVVYTKAPIPGNSTVTVKNVRDLATYEPDGTAGNIIAPPYNSADILLTDGIITYRAWGALNGGSGIGGVTIADLTSQTNRFPDHPDMTLNLTQAGAPNNIGNNYGGQIIGFLVPPESGNYNFVIATDDQGIFYLGHDATAASKYPVCLEPVWNSYRNYTGTDRRSMSSTGNSGFISSNFPGYPVAANGSTIIANQAKNTIGGVPLIKGNKYYFEGLFKEGGGGDNIDVTWQLPSQNWASNPNLLVNGQDPVPGVYLSLYAQAGQSGPVGILTPPADTTTDENQPITFSVVHGGSPSFSYQWYRNGIIVPDANARTYTVPLPSPADNGAKYSVRVRNLFSQATSAEATLTVNTDTTKPTLVRAVGSASFDTVTVWFSEVVDAATAGNVANYSIKETVSGNGLSIFGAPSFSGPGPGGYTRVTFSTGPQTSGVNYTVTVNNVKDIAATPNTIVANSTVTFTGWVISKGFVLYRRYLNVTGGIAGLTADPNYPNNPDLTKYKTVWYEPQTDPNLDSFGDVHSGFFYPDQSGKYNFYEAADDPGSLFISTDSTPGNLVQVIADPAWRDVNQWTGVGSGGTADGSNNTWNQNLPVLTMAPGQARYMELLHVEGGGGDHSEATFTQPGAPEPANGSPSKLVGKYIGAYANPDETTFTFTTQPPTNVVASEGTFIQLSADGSGASLLDKLNNPPTAAPVFWQWQKKATNAGAAWVDIDGANSTTFQSAPLTVADNGAQFRAVASIPGLASTSVATTVSLVADLTPPMITAVAGTAPDATTGNENTALVYFSERVITSEAQNVANYTITGPGNTALAVTAASQSADGKVVTLTTANQIPGTVYSISITGIHDVAANDNLLSPDPTVKTFTAWKTQTGYVKRQVYLNVGGGNVSDLTGNAKFPNSPDYVDHIDSLYSPQTGSREYHDWSPIYDPSQTKGGDGGGNFNNFGDRMTGYLVPTTTGDYYFAISSDDQSEFYLSTDATVANKALLCVEPAWNGEQQWTNASNQGSRVGSNNFFPTVTTLPINRSDYTGVGARHLIAGQQYYFETLHKEGGGGDSVGVTWWPSGGTIPANGARTEIQGANLQSYVNPDNTILISQQPVDQTVGPGTNVTFSVTASASAPMEGGSLAYQWMRAGTNLVGANGPSYSFTATSGDNGANYSVQISAPGAPTVTSNPAMLTVVSAVVPTTLAITHAGNNVIVTYPTADHNAGQALQKATSLSSPLTFTPDNSGADVSGTWTTTVDITNGNAADQSYWRTMK